MKLALFDTSFWRKFSVARIDTFYPRSSWNWCVNPSTDLELMDHRGKKDVPARRAKLKALTTHRVQTTLPNGLVHRAELERQARTPVLFPPGFPIEPMTTQTTRWLNIDRWLEGEPLPKVDQEVENQRSQEALAWERVRAPKGFSSETSTAELDRAVNDFLSPDMPKLIFPGETFGSAVRRIGKEVITDKCPSVMCFLRSVAIFDIVDPLPSGQFDLDGTSHTISGSSITDLKIGACFLPRVEEFATSDKGQARLLAALFPQYASRVKYFADMPPS